MKIYFRGECGKLVKWSGSDNYSDKDQAIEVATKMIKRNKGYLEKGRFNIAHPIVVIK